MSEETWERPSFLKEGFWRDFVENMKPWPNESLEHIMNDKTNVFVNAPRAMIALEFQSKVIFLTRLYSSGLTRIQIGGIDEQ